MLLRIGIRLRTIFIPSLVLKQLQDACTELLLGINETLK